MRRTAFVLALLLVCSRCFAWGGEGHQLVALVAEGQLTPAAKAEIARLLGPDVHISDAEIANWADQIRQDRPTTSDWHYVNIPVNERTFDAQRDGRKGDNVIDKLTEQAKLLADKSASREKRTEALKWVVHLAGDIHQPLHCADRNGDKGGNTRLVMYPGQREAQSLHMVWDTWLVRDLVSKHRIAEAGGALNRSITPVQRKQWATGTPVMWANETHRVAVEKVYAGIPPDGPPPTLGTAYVDKSMPIVADQIKRAGTRLAWILNESAK
jgi:hypothetical protein